ncbi:hypothetical protein CKO18_08865 [Rhodoferax fermentans]|uniref:Uncharacterized protein n=2 Tax=Rhodoferax fermentans TaxID=28066 RepID=A0A1T1AS06_RHOFE|nr:hypothetical protein [Rhodoferax fermentans]OOV06899.1 hypothetical protein RF819_09290 [Rhodoferax fermentans]
MATNTLASLKFTTAKKPTQLSPVHIRRNKLAERIDEQIALATALAEGRIYAPSKTKVVTDADSGEKSSVQTAKRVKTWFWNTADGKVSLTIKYGSKILDLSGGKNRPTIEVASASELVKTLELVKAAAGAGELDDVITAASDKLRKAFGK